MTRHRRVLKIGLAAIDHGQLLVVRKRGTPSFILPGGKPEAGEDDLGALAREIDEELGCSIKCPMFEGSFSDTAADLPGLRVVVRLYSGQLVGTPRPAAEIEELAWLNLKNPTGMKLAPSIRNQILPYLQRLMTADTGSARGAAKRAARPA